jgi:hypothetical protein
MFLEKKGLSLRRGVKSRIQIGAEKISQREGNAWIGNAGLGPVLFAAHHSSSLSSSLRRDIGKRKRGAISKWLEHRYAEVRFLAASAGGPYRTPGHHHVTVFPSC